MTDSPSQQILINQIPIEITDGEKNIYYSFIDPGRYQYGVTQKNLRLLISKLSCSSQFKDKLLEVQGHQEIVETIFFSFNEVEGWEESTVNLNVDNYLRPIYLQHKLIRHLQAQDLLISLDFIGNVQAWEKIRVNGVVTEYRIINIKYEKNSTGIYLSLAVDSQCSYIHNSPLNSLDINQLDVKKVKYQNTIVKKKFLSKTELSQSYPLLCREIIFKQADLRHLPIKFEFTFRNYFENISSFYENYLKDKQIDDNIKIFSSGFRALSPSEIFYIENNKNKLVFGNAKEEYDTYRGFLNYGPYSLSENSQKAKFIFIFHENDRIQANNLYRYLLYGHKNFPGLESYTGIKFTLDKQNSIIFNRKEDLYSEVLAQIESKKFDAEAFYIALYLSPFPKEVEDADTKQIYFKVKELLLSKNISSQVIYSENLKSQNIHFYLPNISIAIVAKTGGIPWKLKRHAENFLLLGFGDSTVLDGTSNKYVGNTVSFSNDGTFNSINCFEHTNENLKESLEKSLKEHLETSGTPSRLIIHYYKDWSNQEDKYLNKVFRKLNLTIPYVVININETQSKDYICFDMNHVSKMPISGTVIKINKDEFLLFNNDRYGYKMSSFQGKDKYPVKIFFSAYKNINLNDEKEVEILIDQIFQFSRLYWRSVKQRSLPVTIFYAKSLAKMISSFESKTLPDSSIARKTLWFI